MAEDSLRIFARYPISSCLFSNPHPDHYKGSLGIGGPPVVVSRNFFPPRHMDMNTLMHHKNKRPKSANLSICIFSRLGGDLTP